MRSIGDTITHKGQDYTVVETFERSNANGGKSVILRWLSSCAECCEPFTITTPAASSKFEPNRRCHKHKRPGTPVKEVRA